MNISLILTAAGLSTRMGTNKKKEFLVVPNPLYKEQIGTTVLSACAFSFLQAFKQAPSHKFPQIIITIPENQEKAAKEALFSNALIQQFIEDLSCKLVFITGSDTRQKSIFEALKYLNKESPKTDIVLIHDAARPWISLQVINNVIETTIKNNSAVPVIPAVDTQKQVDYKKGIITTHLKREEIVSVQTPQGFSFPELYKANLLAIKENISCTDDSQLWDIYNNPVHICNGSIENKKITYLTDLEG